MDESLLRAFWLQIPQLNSDEFLLIKWLKPHDNKVKLNTGGCAKGNPGPGGGGYIIRNSNDEVVCAQADASL